jgi:hypothetical protein
LPQASNLARNRVKQMAILDQPSKGYSQAN